MSNEKQKTSPGWLPLINSLSTILLDHKYSQFAQQPGRRIPLSDAILYSRTPKKNFKWCKVKVQFLFLWYEKIVLRKSYVESNSGDLRTNRGITSLIQLMDVSSYLKFREKSLGLEMEVCDLRDEQLGEATVDGIK